MNETPCVHNVSIEIYLSLIILLYSLLLIMVVFSRGNLDEFSQEIDDNGIQFL